MKTAEELAEEFLLKAECGETTWSDEFREALACQFVSDLTAFAEGRVKEAVKQCMDGADEDIAEGDRAGYLRGLEEAATMASSYLQGKYERHGKTLSGMILALKSKP